MAKNRDVQNYYFDIDDLMKLRSEPSAACAERYVVARVLQARFVLRDYLPGQPDLTAGMRAVLVDWLVEVQENFELNHETLYLAVKLVDHLLGSGGASVQRDRLQLIGAAALFSAAKFDVSVVSTRGYSRSIVGCFRLTKVNYYYWSM